MTKAEGPAQGASRFVCSEQATTNRTDATDRVAGFYVCEVGSAWRQMSDFASLKRPRGFSAAAAAATPAALQNTSPYEPSVRFTSDAAAPAGAEISRPASRPKAVPRTFRKTFLLLRGYSRSHTCCASEHLAVRTFGEIHLRCGCACRRGNFTPSLPVEALPRSLPPAPFWASASRNLVTMRHCPGTAGGVFRSVGVGTDVLHDRAGRLNRDAQDAGSPLLHATFVAVFV